MDDSTDERYMRVAIAVARYGVRMGDRPHGCVIVDEAGIVVAEGYGSETPFDPTAHSELKAIRQACGRREGLLRGCTLYATFEPCPMCCGAINHAKVSRVVWGASRCQLEGKVRMLRVSHWDRLWDTSDPPQLKYGVLQEECIALVLSDPELAGRQGGPMKASSRPLVADLAERTRTDR